MTFTFDVEKSYQVLILYAGCVGFVLGVLVTNIAFSIAKRKP